MLTEVPLRLGAALLPEMLVPENFRTGSLTLLLGSFFFTMAEVAIGALSYTHPEKTLRAEYPENVREGRRRKSSSVIEISSFTAFGSMVSRFSILS